MSMLRALWLEDDGQGLVEYSLVLALIIIAIIVIFTTVGDRIKRLLTELDNEIDTPPPVE